MAQKAVRAPKRKHARFTRDDAELTLLSLPTVIWFIMFSYLPMIGIFLAFKNYRFIPGTNFLYSFFQSDGVGLKNFQFLFRSPDTFYFMRNTLLYNLCFIALNIAIPVTLAIMVSMLRSNVVKKTTQTMIFFPYFLSWAVISYFVIAFLSHDKGLANKVIMSLGGEGKTWYMTGQYWPPIIIFLNTWKGIGYSMVVYMAAVTGFDASYYEAAVIDGATKWQQVRFITLPLLRPTITILTIMAFGGIIRTDIGLFYLVTQQAPGAISNYVQTIDVYVYKSLLASTNFGFSSAAAAFQSIVGCVMIVLANMLVKRVDPDSAFF